MRGAIQLDEHWLLQEGILRIIRSAQAIAEAYDIYKASSDVWIKARCVSLMREIPNPVALDHFEEFLSDPDVAIQAVQMLEKQLWYAPGLCRSLDIVKLVEMAEAHPKDEVRAEARHARSQLRVERRVNVGARKSIKKKKKNGIRRSRRA